MSKSTCPITAKRATIVSATEALKILLENKNALIRHTWAGFLLIKKEKKTDWTSRWIKINKKSLSLLEKCIEDGVPKEKILRMVYNKKGNNDVNK